MKTPGFQNWVSYPVIGSKLLLCGDMLVGNNNNLYLPLQPRLRPRYFLPFHMLDPSAGNLHGLKPCIGYAIIVMLMIAGPQWASSAQAQQEQVEEEPINTSSDKLHSFRGSIYKNTLKRIEDDGYDSQFKLRLSIAVYEPEFLNDVLNLKFRSYGLRPRVSFKVPTPIKNTSFVPSIELAATYEKEQKDWLYSGSIFLGLDYDNERRDSTIGGTLGLKYGTKYDDDGFNPSDYLEFLVVGRFRQNLKWKIKEHTTTLNPFAQASYFLDNLEYGTEKIITGDRRRRYEIGIKWSTLPRMKVGGVRVPEFRISYFFGDGVQGFKFRI